MHNIINTKSSFEKNNQVIQLIQFNSLIHSFFTPHNRIFQNDDNNFRQQIHLNRHKKNPEKTIFSTAQTSSVSTTMQIIEKINR